MGKFVAWFSRSFREGARQVWRNKFLSMTTVLLGALILFLMNFLFSVEYFLDESLKKMESRADFSVPLRDDYDAFTFDALKNDLNNNYDVEIKFLKVESFEIYSLPARIHIKFHNLAEVGTVLKRLKAVRYDTVVGVWDGSGELEFVKIVDKLLKLRTGMEKLIFWLFILFLGGGILLGVNTFRLVIFSRKDEVYISRLVGADSSFIAGPFLIEGLLLGFIAALLAIIVFVLVLREISILPGGEVFLHLWNEVFSEEILIAGAVGVLGAWISIKNYLVGRIFE